MFLAITPLDEETGSPFETTYINMHFVKTFVRGPKGTVIIVQDRTILIKETPKEIFKQIKDMS